ncbi:MAG TPA: glycosyltransferase family 4 protein [Crinalium sp.]|jgi:glycosyltransferase involved in cell wall biosynthesis
MKLLILASHPVQYHAPVFRGVSQRLAEAGHECLVVYLSDFSIQGYRDAGFGTNVAWDEPLLDGYRSVVLNPNSTQQPQGFRGLKAPGWANLLKKEQPTRLMVTTLNYQGAVSAVLQAKGRGIPATLRVETTDVSFPRSGVKQRGRAIAYRTLYSLFDSAIAFGHFSQAHLLAHGFSPSRVGLAQFSVPDRFEPLSPVEKTYLRQTLRHELGFADDQTVILFSGKLIPKKNPMLLLEAIAQLSEAERQKIAVLYLGSGSLEADLQAKAATLPDVTVHFAGFKNQQELPPYYLGADLFVLPSRRQGEVWGLVVNEALQAGLPCIVTDAVGCAPDFAAFPDFQTIPEDSAADLARAIAKQLHQPRDFERFHLLMQSFSTEYAAKQIASFLLRMSNDSRTHGD